MLVPCAPIGAASTKRTSAIKMTVSNNPIPAVSSFLCFMHIILSK